MNHRMIVARYGGPEVLQSVSEPLQIPKSGEVRVKVQSAGVALADIMRREGVYPMTPHPPFSPGYDAVGVIDELGPGVEAYSVGDRVAVFFNGTGSYAEYVYASEDQLISVPKGVDAAEAVTIILNYVTAYQMLHRIAKVREGERILVHGASGGVGTALLELGRLANLKMFGTASLAKHAIVADYGAVPIDYRSEDFVKIIQAQAPEGIDAVFDPIGGKNWERSLKTLTPKGRFVGYGYTSILENGTPSEWIKEWSRYAERSTASQGISISLYSITTLKKERLDWFQKDATELFSLLEAGRIHPIISNRIALKDAAHAHELLEKSISVGKIVLIP